MHLSTHEAAAFVSVCFGQSAPRDLTELKTSSAHASHSQCSFTPLPHRGPPCFARRTLQTASNHKKWIRFKHDLLACHNLSHYLNSSTIALKIRGRCGFWGAEVWNVVLTMKLPPSPPSTRELIQLQLSCCGQILSTAPYHMGKS